MNEADIRSRIAQFLKKTARTVVVPASMGLGLSSAGCEEHGLHSGAADAGPDSSAQTADIRDLPGLPPDLGDAAIRNDLPLIMVPYLVVMVPDAAAEVAIEAGDAQGLDADRDGGDAASVSPPDVAPDLAYPEPPYLAPSFAPDKLPGGAHAEADPAVPPEKK
jgi:hypothetical protein